MAIFYIRIDIEACTNHDVPLLKYKDIRLNFLN